jgi:hypothetical protein
MKEESSISTDASELISNILSSEDYYEILGLDRTASESDIKKRYRTIARTIHPDKCSLENCEDAFKKVGTAYKCLSSEESRKTYDLTGNDGENTQSHHPGFDNEMFSQMFSAHGGRNQSGFYTNVDIPQLPQWLIAIIQLIPWKIAGPILIIMGMFYFFKLLVWILSLSLYIVPSLYLAPYPHRWYLVLLILILSLFGTI